MTRDRVNEDPVFQWRSNARSKTNAVRKSLETDITAVIVSKKVDTDGETDGEYVGMYSIETVVPMR